MLWTGGKDSALAMHRATVAGYRICCLITFAPPNSDFLAHPLPLIKLQAQALALPHHTLPITVPFDKKYEAGLRWLRDEMGITSVVTGDIAETDGQPNWIRERSQAVGLNVHTPLWEHDRATLLQDLLDSGFKAHFSCVKIRWFDASWINRELNAAAIDDLRLIRERTGLDLCGEEGEYHTMVIDGPCFTRGIDILSYSKRVTDSLAYMDIHELALRNPE